MSILSWRTLALANLLACLPCTGYSHRVHTRAERLRGAVQEQDKLSDLSLLLSAMNNPRAAHFVSRHRSDEREHDRLPNHGTNRRMAGVGKKEELGTLIGSHRSPLMTVIAGTRKRNPLGVASAAIGNWTGSSKHISAVMRAFDNWTRSHPRVAAIATALRSWTRSHPKLVAVAAFALLFDLVRKHPRRHPRNQHDIDESLARIMRTRKGFYEQIFQEVEPQQSRPGENSTFCVQQVQGQGDCLFHSIAIGIAFEDDHCHMDMNDPSLTQRVRDLRILAVDTLVADSDRMLYLEGDESISTGELVAAAAEQYNLTAEQYCNWMRADGVWGGGPEILALVNALERPIHVFEPVPVDNGTRMELQLCGAFGSPRFDHRRRICICAADDRFPDCKPVEVKRHGEGGGHFLSLLPTHGHCLPDRGSGKK